MNHYKKIFTTLILLILMFSPVFASLITLDWQWESNDNEVTSFRYKLNDNEWVVVDPSVTQFTLTGVDGNASYRFEVQQSYDGVNFSESAAQSYAPEVTKEEEPSIIVPPVVAKEEIDIEEPVIEEEIVIEEEPPVVEEVAIQDIPIEEEPILEEPVAEETPKKVAKLTPPSENDTLIEALDSSPWMAVEFMIGAGGKGDNKFFESFFDATNEYQSLNTMILPSVSFDFIYGNLITLSPRDSFNLRAGFGFNLYKLSATSASVVGSDIHAGLDYNRILNEKWNFISGAGLSFMFTGVNISTSGAPSLFYGPYLTAGVNYKISDIFSLVAVAETKLLFSNVFTPYELTGIVRVGFTYRF
ncbi:MAG: hypothetical protein EOM67_04815 [Spirochaetia bacterium]|nr:hypothetical protein [Spirochaetia bacterium]